jgi:hypothetical protein
MQLLEQPGSLKSWDGKLKRLPSMTTLKTPLDNSSNVCLQFRTHIGIQDDAWTLFDMIWGEHSSRDATLVTVREKITSSKRSFDACASNAGKQSIQVAEWKARDDKDDAYTDLLEHSSSSSSCPSKHKHQLQIEMQRKCTGHKALAKQDGIPIHSKDDFVFIDDQPSCNWATHQVIVECHTDTGEEGRVEKSTHYYIPHCKPSDDATHTVPCAQANLLHCAFKKCVADLEGLADRHWWSSFFERGDTHWQGMPSAAFPPKPRVPPPATGDKILGVCFVFAFAVMYMAGLVLAVNHLDTDTRCDACNPYMCVLFVVLIYAVREAVAS